MVRVLPDFGGFRGKMTAPEPFRVRGYADYAERVSDTGSGSAMAGLNTQSRGNTSASGLYFLSNSPAESEEARTLRCLGVIAGTLGCSDTVVRRAFGFARH